MVKTKKGKKEVVSSDDEMVNNETTTIDDRVDAGSSDDDTVTAKNKKNKKKDGNKKKPNKPAKSAASDDEDVDDDDDDDKVSAITESVKKLKVGKKAKSKNSNARDSDDGGAEGSDDEKPIKQKKKNAKKANKSSGFDLLMAEDDDEPCKPMSESDDEPPVEVEVKPKKNEKAAGKKGKKGKRKDNDEDDEDLDKVLAELQMEYAGQKPPAEVVVASADDIAQQESKKKNKKGGKAQAPAAVEDVDNEGDDNGESTVKTAAQKKKEKKERQKKEAALAKQRELEGKSKPSTDPQPEETKEASVEPEPEQATAPAAAEKEESTTQDQPEDNEKSSKDDKKKKGKKDKKEKKVEEEKKDDKKGKSGMSKSVVAAMQERLKKIKEEEERLAREEEERIRLEEERETQRLEAIRLEQEKKEKKKQKEAERKARLKAEGKLLTKKQKEDRARAQAMLDALKAQGLEIPDPTEKRPRPGTRYRPSKKKGPAQKQEEEKTEDQSQNESSKDNTPQPEDEKNLEETVKESWDASASEEEEEDSQEKSSEAAQPGEDDNAAQDKDDEETDSADEDSSDDSSDGDDDDGSDGSDGDEKRYDPKMKRERALSRMERAREEANKRRTTDDLRAAVVCVLGHVDTGKTKILDKLRRTHVQDSEAGGITQQIGATNVPIDAIKEQAKVVKGSNDFEHRLPGLLIIDTPGHESFSNLRNRGSSLCDISILVVDIMHGLEPQTIESISLLKKKKCPFIVALNKIDRLYDWQVMPRKDIRDVIKGQQANTQVEFQQRTKEVILQFAEQGLNAALFYDNPDPRTYVSLVPTSAITGEGMGNLLFLIVEFCQNMLAKRLMYSDELQATVLEVKAIPGLGTTIDAILINGKLREGQTMILAGTDGPITTQIRSLLMPQPLKELRVKNAYVEYKEIKAAQGVKIAAKDLEKAIAGINLLIANKPDEIEICREEVAKELKSALSHIKLSTPGVFVQASTLGSLEALLEFLRTSKIPYFAIRIGPVVKRDVMKASTMLEHEAQYATILAFDVKVERDAQEMADSLGVKIFQADIIYHLFDKFMSYREELKQKKRDEFRSIAVFPCKLKILPQFIFNSRDPIVMGVMVENGIVKEGTPICVPSKEFVDIGVVTSIECNHKQIETARKGQEICIKIEPIPGESPKMFGRHFDADDMLVSKITRQSIDACKNYFRDDLIKADWALMLELKKTFEIL
ncbi:eukaryotic translation initiation factor 5B [Eupeodes corollae]|uniref:eukaryotic translation initiation factor 5B n=1 Tax=Eupeodes corollae TaxID=290404 RepID=UPI002492C8F3|nr:eukaryotic translation initiation factor 5B [Eupeodes corollae]